MKRKKTMKRGAQWAAAGLCLAMAAMLCVGCGEAAAPTQTASEATAAPAPEKIVLSQTYTTRFEEVNQVTYPAFAFDYPAGWKVAEEEVTAQTERVTLANERGAKVVFACYMYGRDYAFGGSSVSMARVEVAKAADARFVPGYVQGTDHADLGPFMVAKLKVTGMMDMQTEETFTDVDGGVSYAVLPASCVGTREDVRGSYETEFSFWYSAYLSLTTQAPEDGLTEQEEREVQAILASFRTAE